MPTPLRDQLVARKIEPDPPTEYSRGYNDGIDTGIELVDQAATEHAGATSTATTAKLGELRAAGKKTGGQCPYGFELAPDGRTLREVPAEQRVIALVRQLRLFERRSWRAIAAALLTQGFRPRSPDVTRFVPAQLRRMVESTRSPAAPMGVAIPVSAARPVPRVSGKRQSTKRTAKRRTPRR